MEKLLSGGEVRGKASESTFIKIIHGRIGEALVYRHLSVGDAAVEWVNKESESGRPFDLKVVDREGRTFFIEVYCFAAYQNASMNV